MSPGDLKYYESLFNFIVVRLNLKSTVEIGLQPASFSLPNNNLLQMLEAISTEAVFFPSEKRYVSQIY